GFHFEKGCLKLSYGKKSRICVKKEPFISIVIPASFYCNNILDMIYTVSKQNYQNWECIVFDNNLDRPLSEVIEDIGDSRVKIFRSEKLLSTAQCWNSAVDKATGDYVCVIGDDGGVGPLFMRTVADIVRSNKPDMIYSSVFKLLSSRGSPTGSLGSCVDLPSRSYSSNVASSFRLGSKYAIDVARASLSFRRAILFNMQSLIFERGFLNYLRRDGLIFHSPLPDQYLANLGFCLAKSIVIAPKPIAIAGVSGNYIGNRSLYEDDNFKDSFPGTINMNDPIYNILKSKILPGSLFNTHYLVTMRYLQDHLDDFSPSEVDFDRYRKLQIAANLFHSNEDNWIGEVNYTVREQLTAQENEWLENLIDLTNRCETDESARTTLAEIRSELAIFAFSPVAQPVDTRSFKTLPQFYRAWVRGEVKAP
ncbi:MAG: hypothetical protein CMH45_09110, partial [Muricauda sp.]|nr:hypothetical protein [Allomuricauda sp.]